jgi:hypothetical protein
MTHWKPTAPAPLRSKPQSGKPARTTKARRGRAAWKTVIAHHRPPRQHTAAGRSLPSRGVLYDARDKSRSLGFSPGTNFSSPLKSPVFLGRVRAGMLRRHFVLGFRYDRTITAAKGVMTRAARWAICKPASGSELQTQARHKQNTGPQRPTPHPGLKGRSQQSQVRQHPEPSA